MVRASNFSLEHYCTFLPVRIGLRSTISVCLRGLKWSTAYGAAAPPKSGVIEWTEQPIALAPSQPYESHGCYSGSGIVQSWRAFTWLATRFRALTPRRLAEFLAEAGRYRKGWLGCDSAVADLRLSGVFRLDEPMQMLRNISHLLPVKIVQRTRWWVRIVAVA
mgnify:CR=1 FL=1